MHDSTAISSGEPHAKWWFIRYWLRRFWHKLVRLFHGIAQSRFLSFVLPPITGSYFLILDIWGDKWSWITDHQEDHELIFLILLLASLLSLFAKGFSTTLKVQNDETANTLLTDFIASVGAIVEAKTQRFRESAPNLRKNSNTFRVITHPDQQFRVISNAASDFICKAFAIKKDCFDLTILRRKAGSDSWHYIFKHQNWKHSEPDNLFGQRSAAEGCLQTREYVFFPDKYKSARDRQYLLSERDKRRGPGSAFIYPSCFETAHGEEAYILSIVTYQSQLCDDWDQYSIPVTESFLREFCRRLELELSLYTMKHSQNNEKQYADV